MSLEEGPCLSQGMGTPFAAGPGLSEAMKLHSTNTDPNQASRPRALHHRPSGLLPGATSGGYITHPRLPSPTP